MSFERRANSIYFGARMDVNTKLRDIDPASLAAYLREPTAIMAASWPRDRIQNLDSPGNFRLIQEPINFAGLATIDFFVDVHVDVSPQGTVTLESYDIQTTATINGQSKRVPVQLKLRGGLDPVFNPSSSDSTSLESSRAEEGARLKGFVGYEASGPLQGPLVVCPDPVLKIATEAINRAILLFARRDFVQGIARNYRLWLIEPTKTRDGA